VAQLKKKGVRQKKKRKRPKIDSPLKRPTRERKSAEDIGGIVQKLEKKLHRPQEKGEKKP